MKPWSLLIILVSAIPLACCAQDRSASVAADPYLPSVKVHVDWKYPDGRPGKPDIGYEFTQAQLEAMSRTKLDSNRFRIFVESKWPIERLRTYCTPTNIFPAEDQNLVALRCPVRTDVHKGRAPGFTRIWAYVSEDDGRGTYLGEAATTWHRWEYSLNMERGGRHWVIFDALPNDFMDSNKYSAGEAGVPATQNQPPRSETNGASGAARPRP
jgi:hypothetical protein